MSEPMYSQEALDAAAQRIAKDRGVDTATSDDIALAGLVLNAAITAEHDALPAKTINVPMSGLPDDTPDLSETIEQAKRDLQSAIRGDYEWAFPEADDIYQERHHDEPIDEAVNMAAPTPEIYKHAHAFMSAVFGEDAYTPDSIGQLVDVFVPCLSIMVERGYEPEGKLWRKAGVFGPLLDAYKKWDRFWYRTWTEGKRHDDSGIDLINFLAFTLRADPDSRFGELGEPAPPQSTEVES